MRRLALLGLLAAVRQDGPVRRATPLGLLAAALVGCGGSGAPGPQPGAGSSSSPLQGTTSQGKTIQIAAARGKVSVAIDLALACSDGSTTSAQLATAPQRPPVAPDGTFYYDEEARTPASRFPGYGPGTYRGAISGRIRGATASGKAAFRITFKETRCRAGVKWTAGPA